MSETETEHENDETETTDPQDDPLLTDDPAALESRLRSRLFGLEDRRNAQDYQKRVDELIAELTEEPTARAAREQAEKEKAEAEKRAKAEARAARGIPHSPKTTIRAIGRTIARVENALDDLLEEREASERGEERHKTTHHVARLADSMARLGNIMNQATKTRLLVARTKLDRTHREETGESEA